MTIPTYAPVFPTAHQMGFGFGQPQQPSYWPGGDPSLGQPYDPFGQLGLRQVHQPAPQLGGMLPFAYPQQFGFPQQLQSLMSQVPPVSQFGGQRMVGVFIPLWI